MSRGAQAGAPNRSGAEKARQTAFHRSPGKTDSESFWSPQGGLARLGDAINITENVRKYADEQGIAGAEVFEKGMADKSGEFTESGAELYANA